MSEIQILRSSDAKSQANKQQNVDQTNQMLNSYLDRIEHLERENNQLKTQKQGKKIFKKDSLADSNRMEDVNELMRSNRVLKSDLDNINQERDQLEMRLDELERELREKESEIDRLQNEVMSMEAVRATNNRLMSEINNLQDQLRKLDSLTGSSVSGIGLHNNLAGSGNQQLENLLEDEFEDQDLYNL